MSMILYANTYDRFETDQEYRERRENELVKLEESLSPEHRSLYDVLSKRLLGTDYEGLIDLCLKVQDRDFE